ncbi:MAG: DNA/RNA nuclease SfsA [Candidatus Glassbacteria bacterium]
MAGPLLKYERPLFTGTLIRRYKRFLADVELGDGRRATVHVPNSGSMKTCGEPSSQVVISDSGNPARKLPLTLELVRVTEGPYGWAGVNTGLPNRLVALALEKGIIPELAGYGVVKREVTVARGTRLDLVLEGGNKGERCLIEIKNVTLRAGRAAAFPDAVTERGRKHLEALARAAALGERAVIFFLVQRPDCEFFTTADFIDKTYGETLRRVNAAGVEVIAWCSRLSLEGADLAGRIPYRPGPYQG